MLPIPLLLLLQVQLIRAQTSSTRLSVNQLYNFTSNSLPKPPVFSLPDAQGSNVSISVALCAGAASPPRFFVTNDTSITQPGPSDLGDPNVFEIALQNGLGSWTGIVHDGGFLSVTDAGQTPFELGVSQNVPLHEVLPVIPLLGDTTSNQALIFSPPLSNSNTTRLDDPTYPNYVLPSADISQPDGAPALPIDVAVFIAPTSSSGLSSLPLTGCAMRAASFSDSHFIDSTKTDDNGLWLRDESGWRWQWLINGLTPSTNYTTFVIQNGTKISESANFVTKSGSFSCPIVHSLPYCPTVNYAIPLAQPASPATAYTNANMHSSITDPLLEVLTNFTISLSTFPCGRDYYSPLVSCADCQRAYRAWLCSIWFTRCSEASPDNKSNANSQQQQPMSALLPQPTSITPRSPGLPSFQSDFTALLPCLETCSAVDRACPNFLGFKCPVPKFTAGMSYGVGYIDRGEDEQGGGSTGTAQDRWGNVWCNGT